MLFLGSLTAEKDPLAALDAVERAGRSVPVRMRVVGGGAQERVLGEKVERCGLGAEVELVGVVADVLPHLEWADVLILTSATEGLPGAVLEAAFAGLPTVGFDVGGVSEAVIDGSTGRLVARGDIDALSAVLVELACRPDPDPVHGRGGAPGGTRPIHPGRGGRSLRLHLQPSADTGTPDGPA